MRIVAVYRKSDVKSDGLPWFARVASDGWPNRPGAWEEHDWFRTRKDAEDWANAVIERDRIAAEKWPDFSWEEETAKW